MNHSNIHLETPKTTIFILDDNALLAIDIKQYLSNKFGANVNLTAYFDGKHCLENLDAQTDIVILDINIGEENGIDILKAIKAINPKTNVIMFTGNEKSATRLESLKYGAIDYIIKGQGYRKKLFELISLIINNPITSKMQDGQLSE